MQNPIGGHCVLVIGYSREVINGEEVEFWLIQNTHGVRWGNNGVYWFDMNIRDMHGNLLINGVGPLLNPAKERLSTRNQ
jgi:hypothetical protein